MKETSCLIVTFKRLKYMLGPAIAQTNQSMLSAEVNAFFGEKIKVALIEKIFRMMTKEPISMGGVIMANFIVSSHIKVLPGSVYKSFLKVNNIPEGDFENSTVIKLLEEGITNVLNELMTVEFNVDAGQVGSVDWSYNITYKAKTFKVKVLRISADYLEVYVLVAPSKDKEERIKKIFDELINFCTKSITTTL